MIIIVIAVGVWGQVVFRGLTMSANMTQTAQTVAAVSRMWLDLACLP